MDPVPRRGLLVIVSSPSGAGKTTLCRRLMAQYPEIRFSVSVTTRPPRAGEQDGVDYVFVSPVAFEAMVEAGELADWQGGRQLKSQFPDDVVMIWVLPPSLAVLEERLRRRATDSAEAITRRLAHAKKELENYSLYQYLVVNADLDTAYDEVRCIYRAAHLEIRRASARAELLVQQVRG